MPQIQNYIYISVDNGDGTFSNVLDRIELIDIPELGWEDKKIARDNQVLELTEYFSISLTTQQYANLMNNMRNHINDWYLGVPRLRLWFANAQDSNWSANYTNAGFAQMSYFTIARRDKALDILQII